jgi:hypothetical protein
VNFVKKNAVIFVLLIACLLCGIVSAERGSNGKELNPDAVSASALNVQRIGPQSPVCSDCCKIIWDTTHGEYSNDAGFDTYGELVSDLQSKGYTVTPSSTKVDTPGLLAQYNVLVINAGSSVKSPYTQSEVDAIQAFVNNGGGLLIMDEWQGYVGEVNLRPLVSRFGTEDTGFIGWTAITNIDTAQPIFSGVKSFFTAATGELSAQSPSSAVAWYGNQAVVNIVKGKKVVITGDCNLFQSGYPGSDFINMNDNRKFAANVFSYLCKKETHNVPEFPSMLLPVTFIIGIAGAILLIGRTRER